jgi:hypothetical protein
MQEQQGKYNEFLVWARIHDWFSIEFKKNPTGNSYISTWLTPTGRVASVEFTENEIVLDAWEETDEN